MPPVACHVARRRFACPWIAESSRRLILPHQYPDQTPFSLVAAIAQLGERQTEDLEVPGSIPGLGIVDA